MEKIFTAQEVADRLKIKKATVYELIKRGELNATKIGRQIRISQEQLDQYLQGSADSLPGNNKGSQPPIPVSDIPPFTAVSAIRQTDYLLNTNGLIISSQESRVVELLLSQLDKNPESLPMLHSYMNEYNSLYSLYYEKTHMALTCFFSDKKEQSLNQIKNLMPGKELAVVFISQLSCGLYVKKGNPKNIRSIKDLLRPDIRFLNREPGSGYRIFLDSCFIKNNFQKKAAAGYQKECLSHMSAANAVASDAADGSIGDLSLLMSYPQLEPVPLAKFSLDLVFLKSYLNNSAVSLILEAVNSREFKNSLLSFHGYNPTDTGHCTIING
ncbi:substrate-binding domain-containing protein [Lacrimispora sp. JR3]|uniref:substrate-binding domain-containing protein n=1 Tax=Lacrimispora sinapis TaxID=3111456 RepID=UPI00374872B0